jgi:anti-sigma regulatory factor (Ser/Thr protein kinase)
VTRIEHCGPKPALALPDHLPAACGDATEHHACAQGHFVRTVADAAGLGAAARAMALALDFPRIAARQIETAVRELATNIARHAGTGIVLLHGARDGIAVLAVDEGPGIADIASACRDRHDGSGPLGPDSDWRRGLGCGLGAVRRLMDRVEIYSTPGQGTLIIATKLPAA